MHKCFFSLCPKDPFILDHIWSNLPWFAPLFSSTQPLDSLPILASLGGGHQGDMNAVDLRAGQGNWRLLAPPLLGMYALPIVPTEGAVPRT